MAFILAKEKNKPHECWQKPDWGIFGRQRIRQKFSKIELVPSGFINFYLSKDFLKTSLLEIVKEGEKFGDSKSGKGIKINLEFVSANPTGPLTVGNARAASFGDTLGNILKNRP